VLLAELADEYSKSRFQLKPGSKANLLVAVRSLERHAGRALACSELSAELLNAWLAARLQVRAARTVHRERGDLLTLWNFGHETQRAHAPDTIFPIRLAKTKPKAWSLDELERLLLTARATPGPLGKDSRISRALFWEALLLTAYDTAARIGALLECRWCDLHVAGQYLLLAAEFAKTDTEQICGLAPETLTLLGQLRDRSGLPGGGSPADDAKIFAWPHRRQGLWEWLDRLLVRAGLPQDRNRKFHCLRKTCASLTHRESSLEVAQRALGHTSPRQTETYLDPLIAGTDTQAIDVLPRPFGGPAGPTLPRLRLHAPPEPTTRVS